MKQWGAAINRDAALVSCPRPKGDPDMKDACFTKVEETKLKDMGGEKMREEMGPRTG